MRLLLPFILLMFGALLALPLIRTIVVVARSGAADASAMSMGTWSLVEGGIGVALMIVGLVLFSVRVARRNPVGPA